MEEVPWLKFSVTIESTILPCIVETGRFAITASDIGAYVGEPTLAYKLPDAVQSPACNSPLEWFEFTTSSTLTDEVINSIISIDPNEKAVKIQTDDFSLLGQTIVLEIFGYSNAYIPTTIVQPFTLQIRLVTRGP